MHARIPLVEAAQVIAQAKHVSPRMARKVLVAALIEEQCIASCTAYYRHSVPPVSAVVQLDEGGSGIPADFWRMEHADHLELEPCEGDVPTGSWGSWKAGGANRFTTELQLTGFAAGSRYPEFGDLSELGSAPVCLNWTAVGVTIHHIDLEGLIDRGGFSALLKRVERRPSARWGNLSKSDSLRLIARCSAMFLSLADRQEIAANPRLLLKAIESAAATCSQEAAVSDRVLRQFARLVAEEAGSLADQEILLPPS